MGEYGGGGLFKQFKKNELAPVVLHRDASEDFGGIFWKKCMLSITSRTSAQENFESKYQYLHYKSTLI